MNNMNDNLPKFAIFENSLTNENNYCFTNPIEEVIATDETSLNNAFDKIANLQKHGFYLAGYISYEASYYLNNNFKKLRRSNDGVLLHFVAFKDFSQNIPSQESFNSIAVLLDNLSLKDYEKGFSTVTKALENGESYQINYTKMLDGHTELTGLELYTKLKKQQPVKYGAYLPFAENEIISISPELFFKKEDKKLTVRPMKGTARLTNDTEKNTQIYNELENSAKNRSENLIIVDLLRNDMSAICDTHTVKVDKAFTIEKYNNLLQMTSEISGNICKNTTLKQILDKLFPCGSITGAPKKRTMEIIKRVEKENRGVYTGSIGYILPNNDMCFNVAIRTIQKYEKNLKIGVGGGITVYSEYHSEWQEMLTKINFIKQIYKPDFKLIESMYFYNSFTYLDMHLSRLKETAERLFFDININSIVQELLDYATKNLESEKAYKVRLEYDYSGNLLLEHIEIDNSIQKLNALIVCPEIINSNNKLFKYKTTHHSTRGFYTKMHNKYINDLQTTELLFINEKGNVTETRFHNIVIEINDKKYTPKLADGVLDGIYRKKLIESGEVSAKSISLEELKKADKIYIINSVRGMSLAYLKD
ncbi:chorismate-binding protein [Francisella frigiditurris]|uniref:Aminotransferase class IV family protein n=1 Tax=Francisella frigiditurris TaxID=1542390 RepID=A0A1J0KU80_9GAMM|nr:chorismate-binding protein [Francisella frigiditurris]APC97206.1 aminotransferase class IV family protein [Francisella frigiditurris]